VDLPLLYETAKGQESVTKLTAPGVREGQAATWARELLSEMTTGWIEHLRRYGKWLWNPAGLLV
jgi:hypothetical protein